MKKTTKIYNLDNFDFKKLDNLSFDGIDGNDYPDFTDAFLDGADYDGKTLKNDELDWLQDNFTDSLNECLWDYIN